MLDIDGAVLSGSGVIVRQAVAYAAVTGTAIRVRSVRARRPKPGLRPQHLCAVHAVRDLVGGELDGDHVGSGEFTFHPGQQRPRGHYRFDVGTAGSATALSLALLPVAATAVEPVELDLVGGLFQDRAPSAFHLQQVLAPLLGRMGLAVLVTMVRPGYVPTGGGIIRVEIRPSGPLKALVADRQAPVLRIWGTALSSHLQQRQVSRRMAEAARYVLATAGYEAVIEELEDTAAAQPGACLALVAELADGMRLGADRAGAPGRSAERIGRSAAGQLLDEIRSDAVLDRYASDQIIAFAALADGRTRVRLAAVTDHVRTGLWLAEVFGLGPVHLSGHVLTIDGSRVRRGE
jgi:RNA 3'-terminal phosphate cyclase (ATP)